MWWYWILCKRNKCPKTLLWGVPSDKATLQHGQRLCCLPYKYDCSHFVSVKFSLMCFSHSEFFPPLKYQLYCQQRVLWEELNLNFARTDKGNGKKEKKKKNHSSDFILPCLADFTLSFPTLIFSAGFGGSCLSMLWWGCWLKQQHCPITWEQESLNNPESWKKNQA